MGRVPVTFAVEAIICGWFALLSNGGTGPAGQHSSLCAAAMLIAGFVPTRRSASGGMSKASVITALGPGALRHVKAHCAPGCPTEPGVPAPRHGLVTDRGA